MEEPPLDRRRLDDRALFWSKPVDASAEQRVNRRRNDKLPARAPVLVLKGEHLLHEERVALRGFDDPRSQRLRDHVPALTCDQRFRVFRGQGLEQDGGRVRSRRPPGRADLEQIGTRQAEEQNRPAREAADILEQVEEGRLGPVKIVDDDDERPIAPECLDEPPNGPEDLFRPRVAVAEAHRTGDPVNDQLGALVICDELGERGAGAVSADLFDDLGERPVGDPFAVREAAPDHDARPLADRRDELVGQTRLADPGRPEHRHDPAGAAGLDPLERIHELAEFALAADEGGLQPTREGGSVVKHLDQPPSRDLFGLTLERERLGTLSAYRLADEAVRRVAQEDLAGLCGLLEAGGDVHCITGREGLPCAGVAGDDLAGVDPDAMGKARTPMLLQLLVQSSSDTGAARRPPVPPARHHPREAAGCRRRPSPRRR